MKTALATLCLAGCLAGATGLATAAPASTPAAAATPPVAVPAWVERSNVNARYLLGVQAPFSPEFASYLGLAEFDTQVVDLKPDNAGRERAALTAALAELKRREAAEQDEPVKQDLQIMIRATERNIEGSLLEEQYLVNWIDVPQAVFGGLRGLLEDQTPPARRAHALERLKRYAGLVPGTTPVTEQAKALYAVSAGQPGRLYPFKLELDRAIASEATYVKGIRDAFASARIKGAEPALRAIEKQLDDYNRWTRDTVLPRARTDFRLPAALYAYRLKQVGIDIEPLTLVQRAQLEFAETRLAMQSVAAQIARARGASADARVDYRQIVRELKKDQLDRAVIEPFYRDINKKLEAIITRERVVDLPSRPMIMRLASAAESAAQPAPHFQPAPLIDNHGEQGQFVLPLDNPQAGPGQAAEKYDDFTYGAAAWTLSAHEGRPGHELQFTAMLERGVSLARSVFAFNSVNVEGWALYAEAEMQPYEPLEAQMITLQLRLLRAARAMLDPMLNLGLIDRERAGRVLLEDVGVSPAMARQELDRYTFKSPAQAGAYFYGYTRLLQLRTETEVRLGSRFDRLAFNNLVLDQGLLPPDQLAAVVRARMTDGAAPMPAIPSSIAAAPSGPTPAPTPTPDR